MGVAIDYLPLAAHSREVLKLLRLILCWALLAGLAGNGVALAAPCVAMTDHEQVSAAVTMDSPCDEQMDDQQKQAPKPSKATGCLAMVACSAALAAPMGEPVDIRARKKAIESDANAPPALVGRTVAPEPEPPTQLA